MLDARKRLFRHFRLWLFLIARFRGLAALCSQLNILGADRLFQLILEIKV